MDVTDVLRDRMGQPAGLPRMVTVSVLGHAALAAVVIAAPGNFLGRHVEQSRNVMTISLSGAGEGPRNGGFTAAASQPVQVQTPPEELAKREPARPPAAKTPELTLSTSKTPARSKTPQTAVTKAPEDARGRTPTKGTQVAAGNAVAYTGERGQGFGLSTGGGPGTGSMLDVADFCCPDYIATMIDRIRGAWQQNQGGTGDVIIKFVIQRDGKLTGYTIERSSGQTNLDMAAMRAVAQTKLNPLPSQYSNQTLGVHLNFQYR
jgi:TonB family protein